MEKSKNAFLLFFTLFLLFELVVRPDCFVAAIFHYGAKASTDKNPTFVFSFNDPVEVNTIYNQRWLEKYRFLRSSLHQLDSKLVEFKDFRPVAEDALAEQSFPQEANLVGKDADSNNFSVSDYAKKALEYRKSAILSLHEKKLDNANKFLRKAIHADQKSKHLQFLIIMAGDSPLNPYGTVEYQTLFKEWETLKRQEKQIDPSSYISNNKKFVKKYKDVREALDQLDDRLLKFQNFRPVAERVLGKPFYIPETNLIGKDTLLKKVLAFLIPCTDTSTDDLAVSTHAKEALEYRKVTLSNLQEGRFDEAITFLMKAIQADQRSKYLQLRAIMAGRSPPSPFEQVAYKKLFKNWEKLKQKEENIPAPSELKHELETLAKKQNVLENTAMFFTQNRPLLSHSEETNVENYDAYLEKHEKLIEPLIEEAIRATKQAFWYGNVASESFERGKLLSTIERLAQAQSAQELASKNFETINSIYRVKIPTS